MDQSHAGQSRSFEHRGDPRDKLSGTVRTKICTKCGERKPATRVYFNLLPSGSFRGACKRCMAANTRAHYRKDPDKVKARVALYKDQKAAAEGAYGQSDIDLIRDELGDRCNYCGQPLDGGGEVDHKLPISRGGSNWPSNLTLACLTCNRDKHAKTVQEFIEWRIKRGLPVRNH